MTIKMASSPPSTSSPELEEGTSQEVVLAKLWERVTKAEEYKTNGNELYNSKDIRGAIGKYHRALLFIRGLDANLQRNSLWYQLGLGVGGGVENCDGGGGGAPSLTSLPEEMQKKVATVEQGCLNNLAACILLQEDPNYKRVISYCDRVLASSPGNPKALYRKGCSLYHLKSYEEAYDCLKKAQQISKSDPNIRKYLTMAKEKMENINNAQRTMYQGMFNKSSTQSDE
ncbi:tetratricopeptide repeat protein 9C-like [Patiria miniata]|uniref:Tetratricopeptide repeat protein 9C n=1 Tax=Patiria miniata TaxID=46514 RepID=A0A914BAL7_PATMI|nr:tetratricopeptide repeat protein 9C-like [Patiria miniata]XP_038073236.1 tetratricopeptide repeat protein 9C-like [Patiria miniata]XP_038073237.1 tetratricopeptide repeat protein 9C-like [Patiria miniata]XP_038073238.1 tetratricopeptide repeat protein 9C-like [Patiria miniata]